MTNQKGNITAWPFVILAIVLILIGIFIYTEYQDSPGSDNANLNSATTNTNNTNTATNINTNISTSLQTEQDVNNFVNSHSAAKNFNGCRDLRITIVNNNWEIFCWLKTNDMSLEMTVDKQGNIIAGPKYTTPN